LFPVAMSYTAWRELLDALEPYAQITGWRFVLADFMRLDDPKPSPELTAAQERAMPVVLDFAERLQRIRASDNASESPVMQEYELSQRKVAREAVYKTILATSRALGIYDNLPTPTAADDDDGSCAYEDLSQPLEVIVRRLKTFEKQLDAVPGAREERDKRLLEATLVVEFALAHGVPWRDDDVSSSMLADFMLRVKEWGGHDAESIDQVKALVHNNVPKGPAQDTLRISVLRWAEEHPAAALGIGVAIGGLAAAVAGITVAALASGSRSSRR